MSMALKLSPDLALARSSRNSGSSGCCAAISDQLMPMSPMAAMTQFRSAVAASRFEAEVVACGGAGVGGIGTASEAVVAAAADAEGALEGFLECVVRESLGSSRLSCCMSGMLQMSGISSLGLERASATRLAFPST